jgi:hypothetical protein
MLGAVLQQVTFILYTRPLLGVSIKTSRLSNLAGVSLMREQRFWIGDAPAVVWGTDSRKTVVEMLSCGVSDSTGEARQNSLPNSVSQLIFPEGDVWEVILGESIFSILGSHPTPKTPRT